MFYLSSAWYSQWHIVGCGLERSGHLASTGPWCWRQKLQIRGAEDQRAAHSLSWPEFLLVNLGAPRYRLRRLGPDCRKANVRHQGWTRPSAEEVRIKTGRGSRDRGDQTARNAGTVNCTLTTGDSFYVLEGCTA